MPGCLLVRDRGGRPDAVTVQMVDDLSWKTFIVKQNKENFRDLICNEQEMGAVNNGVQMKAFSIVFSPPPPH